MKIQIEQKDLANLVSKVGRAAATSNTIPVLQGMYLKAANGKLTAQATDLEIGVKLDASEVQVHEEGEVLVHSRNFEVFVKNLPSEVITLVTSDNKLQVKYGRSQAQLNLMTDAEYPNLPVCEEEILTIKGNALRKALIKVLPAVAKTHFRQVFTGVLIDIQKDKTVFVGSDTHRLNVCEVAAQGISQKIIVPAKTLDEVLRLVDDEETVVILTNGNNLLFKAGNIEITSRIIDGAYPDYRQVIPTTFVSELNVKTTVLKQSLQRLLTLPKTGAIHTTKISLSETAELSTISDEGEIKEVLDEIKKTGDDLVISFNSNYLMDAVKLMPEETKISFSGQVSPALIKGEDGFLSVLVPLRDKN
ncbi:MAG TPA: DNA polymerase III subunit beta [Tepidanaerobacteraceae bacterium]|nr:DNA polymerase III subunit beta [Tepidanaerobacteraceae bacterium]